MMSILLLVIFLLQINSHFFFLFFYQIIIQFNQNYLIFMFYSYLIFKMHRFSSLFRLFLHFSSHFHFLNYFNKLASFTIMVCINHFLSVSFYIFCSVICNNLILFAFYNLLPSIFTKLQVYNRLYSDIERSFKFFIFQSYIKVAYFF
jgi:hypothetical protein